MAIKFKIKKWLIITLIVSVFSFFFGCSTERKMSDIPEYESKECYYGEGFQDYTDYCKYFYNSDSIKQFEYHDKFNIVTDSDIENIRSYFRDFEEFVKNQSYYDQYDFDCETQIKKDDYFYVFTKEGEKRENRNDIVYGKFQYYDVYYVDVENCVLYFIHSSM